LGGEDPGGRLGSWPLRHRTGTVVSVAAPTASGVPNAAAGASAAACGGCPRRRSSPPAQGQMDLTSVRNEIQILKKSRIAIFGYPRRDPISDLLECAPEQSNQISNEPSKKKRFTYIRADSLISKRHKMNIKKIYIFY